MSKLIYRLVRVRYPWWLSGSRKDKKKTKLGRNGQLLLLLLFVCPSLNIRFTFSFLCTKWSEELGKNVL